MHHWTFRPLRQAAAVVTAATLALVAACGGGGSDMGAAGSPAVTTVASFSQGAISGFGSIIVNGVRWDDGSATITDDDGVSHARSELKLGMVVEIDGGPVDHAAGMGRALAIRYGSETLGPIGAIDGALSQLTVLGQTVVVTPSTVFDAGISGGLAGLQVNDVIEIHGLFDAAGNRTVATRIERRAGATAYRLRGVVAELDPALKTFKIGSELISYGSLTDLPAPPVNGGQVKLRLQTTQVAGAWVATKLRLLQRPAGNREDAEVEGMVTAWTSATRFEVNGMPVDATNASFPDGQGVVVMGARVEVEGAVVDGVLVASQVKGEDEMHHGGMMRAFELHGEVGALDPQAQTFTLRGLTVSYAGNVVYKDGTAAQLVNGARVEVKGTLSADRTRIEASLIDFE
jgi:hypothetical protein